MAAATVNLTIDLTQTDLPAGTPAYAYIIGEVQGSPNTYWWINPSGMPQQMQTSDATWAAGTFPHPASTPASVVAALAVNYPLAWADYSIPLTVGQTTVLNLANINPTNVPGLGTGTAAFSGRVLISAGLPNLPITPVDGGYTAPVFSNPPGYLTLFDWIEFSFDSEQNFNGNTTQVDQFGFELILGGATAGGPVGPQGSLTAARSIIMAAFGPNGFADGALPVAVPAALASGVYPGTLTHLRAISPKTLTAEPNYSGELATWFDTAIAQLYASAATQPVVTTDTATGTWTGYVPPSGPNAGILTFYPCDCPTLAALAAWIAAHPSAVPIPLTGTAPATNRILTSDVWQCANTLASGGAAQLNIGKMIAAALNRGVMSDTLNDGTCAQAAAAFYPAGGTWNGWAQYFHSVSANGLAYGFPYDDVCEQNPTIQLSPAASVSITLGRFFG
jgi:hypothetical protein